MPSFVSVLYLSAGLVMINFALCKNKRIQAAWKGLNFIGKPSVANGTTKNEGSLLDKSLFSIKKLGEGNADQSILDLSQEPEDGYMNARNYSITTLSRGC